MQKRKLGKAGPEAGGLGLGCMGMSGTYGPSDRAESIATIHAALDAGMDLLDTGDFYGMGHNEMLLGEALQGVPRDKYRLSVKFGAMRGADGSWVGYDARPAAVKNFLAYSLNRLGVEYIDIYRPARLDPNVPVEDTIGEIKRAIEAGYVRHIGLSEMGSETVRRAASVHPICDLQIEYSLFSRDIEGGVLKTCRELGVGITAYGVLSKGLLSNHAPKAGEGDMRRMLPRLSGENLGKNAALVEELGRVAGQKGVSVAQIAIAWVMAQGREIVPLIGARTRARLDEALGAANVVLSGEELAAIERAVPKDAVAGTRYAAAQMAHLDSERG